MIATSKIGNRILMSCPPSSAILGRAATFYGEIPIDRASPRRVESPRKTTMAQDSAFATLRAGEERHAFLLILSDALRPLGDPLDMQEVAARLVGEHLQVNRVGYAELSDRRSTIRREYLRGVSPLAGRDMDGAFGPALREAFQRGETLVVSDVRTDPRFSDAARAIL